MALGETEGGRQEQSPLDCGRAKLSLADFTLSDPQFLAHPKPYYGLLRGQDPVHHDEESGLYVVSRYDDIQTVLRDAVTFSQEQGWRQQFARGHMDELKSILIRDGGGFFPEVLLLDPPAHTRIRKLLDKALNARRVHCLEPRVKALVVDRVEAIAARGLADAVSEFSAPLTISIICEQLGFPYAEAADKVASWSRAYSAQMRISQTRKEMLVNARVICELQHFIISQVEKRQTSQLDDTISDLIHVRLEEDQDARLTFEETVALTRGLLLAGNDTTSRAITNFLYIIATRPSLADQLHEVIDDDSQVNRFVEEVLRFAPSVRGLFRITTRDIELGGTQLPKGAHILILFASGNDDETVFTCPGEFDPSRKNVARHLSFGGGIHLCAGIALARMELRTTVREVIKRLKDIRLAIPADEIRYFPSPSIEAIESLPLTFSRRGGTG